MTEKSRLTGVLFLIGAIAALVMLAAGLSNLRLDSGSSFPDGLDPGAQTAVGRALPVVKAYTFPMLEGILALIFIILGVYLAARIILFVDTRTLLYLAAGMAVVLAILYLMRNITLNQPSGLPDGIRELAVPPVDGYSVAPLGPPPQMLIWLVVVALVVGIGAAVITIDKRRSGRRRIEDEFLREAGNAVSALTAGENFRNVILRCYMQMARALEEEQGLKRETTMTARELEDWLAELGFPPDPVCRLTGLFERVRYGAGLAGENDEEIANDSLNQIIEYCRSQKG